MAATSELALGPVVCAAVLHDDESVLVLAVGTGCGRLAVLRVSGGSCRVLLCQQMLPGALVSVQPADGVSLWCLHSSGDAAVLPMAAVSALWAPGGAGAPREGILFDRWALGDRLSGPAAAPWTTLAVASPAAPVPCAGLLAGREAKPAAAAAASPGSSLVAAGGGVAVLTRLEPRRDRATVSLEDAARSALDGARASAVSVTASVPLLGGMVRWAIGGGAKHEDGAALAACRSRPACRVPPGAEWSDEPRRALAGQVLVAPTGRTALVADGKGRVSVVRCADLAVQRMLKGYRAAQVAWLRCPASGGLRAAVFTPKRRCLEVWPPLRGDRIVAAVVPTGHAARLVPWVRGGECGAWMVVERPDGTASVAEVRCPAALA